ncbi:MAG: hypothetical protein KJ606_05650 [Chloroflexi bacterium]|nr:hypothetical protein [Chloroflexota bacterium]
MVYSIRREGNQAEPWEISTTDSSLPSLFACASPDDRSRRILTKEIKWNKKPARKWIEAEFLEFYAPSEPAWLEKAKADARQAFEGILKAEGYL